jgi:hypothetical protein
MRKRINHFVLYLGWQGQCSYQKSAESLNTCYHCIYCHDRNVFQHQAATVHAADMTHFQKNQISLSCSLCLLESKSMVKLRNVHQSMTAIIIWEEDCNIQHKGVWPLHHPPGCYCHNNGTLTLCTDDLQNCTHAENYCTLITKRRAHNKEPSSLGMYTSWVQCMSHLNSQ